MGLYWDLWDDHGNYVGYEPAAWGLLTDDGRFVTISADGRRSVTWWDSVDDAPVALEAKVQVINPRRTLRPDA